VPKGEDWCKNKAGKPWTDTNLPGPEQGGGDDFLGGDDAPWPEE
jgi:hypothetical protein